MKNLPLYISLLLLITCAKEDSQAPNTPPTQIVKQYALTASAGEGGSVSGGGTFASGTQVSLTATPNSGYSFSGWSNGSTANPLNVTLNSNTTITANFEVLINSYTLTVLSSEGGSVTGGGEYEEGTEVTISATPEEGYEFTGWSDGETSLSRVVTISSDISISAIFQADCSIWYNEVPNWNSTSYELFEIYYPENYSVLGNLLYNRDGMGGSGEYGLNVITVDYNNDGYKDVIGFSNDRSNPGSYPNDYYGYERKQPIRFFKGSCGGAFEVDTENDSKYLGLVHGRKLLLGDFNNDSFVDVFFIGHGYDYEPRNGEFNKILMSNGEGGFNETDYTEFVSFYHGGASGDIDNDGDIDIIVTDAGRGKSLLMINNNGDFQIFDNLIDQTLMRGMYNAELFDVNNDGFLDLILGGHDWKYNQDPDCEWWDCLSYNNTPLIIYGDGVDFIGNETKRLPISNVDKQGIVTSFKFFDFNNDGQVEILVTRTGDDMNEEPGTPWDQSNFYKGWSIQIVEKIGDEYVESTDKFIDNYYGSLNTTSGYKWIRATNILDYDNDGILELINSENPYENPEDYLEWELIGGYLVKID